jgi:hypothetical protein
MPLRFGPDPGLAEALALDELQLLDLPSVWHAVGVLRSKASHDNRLEARHRLLFLGQQAASLRQVRDLRLHHVLGTRQQVKESSNGHQCPQL